MSAQDSSYEIAFKNISRSIDIGIELPGQVFIGKWSEFLFFESDRLFAPEFVTAANGLLSAENAEVCCLLNFGNTNRMVYELAATVFIDAGMKPQTYDALLRRGGAANGWLFGMDRYGSASDQGDWSIYCEKCNDIAIIAFRRRDALLRYAECLKQLHAKPIRSLISEGSMAPVPFSRLTESWRRSLTEKYATSE